MKISTITGILLMAVVLINCDSREDYFNNVNQSPVIKLSQSGLDSIKIGHDVTIDYDIIDEEPLPLNFHQTGSSVNLLIDEAQIFLSGITEGDYKLELLVEDSFGKVGQEKFDITVFTNLPPVLNFSVNKIDAVSPNEIEVDASASFDRDERFGGSISIYEYNLNGYTFQSPLSKVRYIFGSAGQKQIKVRVQDNDGVWSDEKSVYFVL